MPNARPSPAVCVSCCNTDPTTSIRERFNDRPPLCDTCYQIEVQFEAEDAEHRAGWDASP